MTGTTSSVSLRAGSRTNDHIGSVLQPDLQVTLPTGPVKLERYPSQVDEAIAGPLDWFQGVKAERLRCGVALGQILSTPEKNGHEIVNAGRAIRIANASKW
ncbi:hypothetical protein [Bradyrhizobium sp. JR3.5]